MITDPYKILEISPKASNDEVKKAYRELSRKYHPDSYINNPLSELAEEKFKEIQEAYNQIMDERERGYSSESSSGHYGADRSGDSNEMNAASNYINARHYNEALHVLSGIRNRTARWYYYSALANSGMGNNMEALNHAKQAASMEPGNQEYSSLLNQLQWGGQRYQNMGYGYGRNSNYGMGNLCCDLWCADTLCECMGGDLCQCM